MTAIRRPATRAAIFIGIWAGVAAIAAPFRWPGVAVLAPLAVGSLAWLVAGSRRWLWVFWIVLVLTPPLPVAGLNEDLHLAPMIVPAGLLSALVWKRHWHWGSSEVLNAFLLFLLMVCVSIAAAAPISDSSAVIGSAIRTGLLAISGFLFAYRRFGPDESIAELSADTRFLFRCAMVAAVLACVDFAMQWPAPAGASQQFVWLSSGVFRRAQGFFYDSSVLGNYCAFFLIMTVVAGSKRREYFVCSRVELGIGSTLLGTALVLSFSRGSMVNLLVAVSAFLALNGVKALRRAGVLAARLIGSALLAWFALPVFAEMYWTRILASVQFASSSPNGVLSGRLTTWSLLTQFIVLEPWHLLVGIGYKMLPVSGIAGESVIGDNSYLSVLVETGILGFCAFLLLNGRILRGAYQAARSTNGSTAFYGSWILCFWAGQMVQMLSGDLITYWRVLPIYFWVLGTALRQANV
jgi:O-antigen ligase